MFILEGVSRASGLDNLIDFHLRSDYQIFRQGSLPRTYQYLTQQLYKMQVLYKLLHFTDPFTISAT